MTEYGRGHGPQPWHPDDPLYGDQGWSGSHPTGYPADWDAAQQGAVAGHPGYPDPAGAQQQAYQPYPPQQAVPQYGGWDGGAAGHQQVYDPSGYGQAGADPYGVPPADPYGMGDQQFLHTPPHGHPQSYEPYDPYAPQYDPHHQQFQQAPQQAQQQAQQVQPQQGHPPQYQQDVYAYPQAHPQPHEQAVAQPAAPAHADPETGWDPGPDQGEHAFFADRDEDDRRFFDDADDADDGDDERDDARNRRGGGKKRSGAACAVVSLALVAGVGVVGYFGYDFYQSHFAAAPDYSGGGSGEVMVEIPDGASVADMGTVLKREGVIKSAGAFTEAAEDNSKAQSIQPGTYTLRKRMSAAEAMNMMLDPSSQNGLIIAEGWRAKKVYEEIDKKLDVPEGTTAKAAKSEDLGLPKWADGKPEGFLFPSRYSVGKNSEPADVLRRMVKRAEAEYTRTGLEEQAKKAGKTPAEVVTIASLIQAEAQQDHEFGKVSRVIYNRLDKNMHLGFDSTINYAMGRSTLNTSVDDTRFPSPYNTYLHYGLPPGPIGNPGHQAIEAALNPTKGDWLYFVTVKPGDTRFTDSESEHQKNVQDFNREQRRQR